MSSSPNSLSSNGSIPISPNGLSPRRNGGMKAMEPLHQTDMKGLQTLENVQQSTDVRDDYAGLKDAFDDLKIKFNDVQDDLRASREELKRLQEQDFIIRSQDGIESHDKVSQQFLNVFRMSTDWARDYFKIDCKSLCLGDHEKFKQHLKGVLWDESTVIKKKKLNVRFLVQAVVADVIARRILLSPFGACASSIREDFSLFYEEMLKGNKLEAHKWRATTLAGYEKFGGWPPSPTASQSIIEHRENYYKEIAQEIESIVGSIAQKHFPERNDHDERLRRSMVFIEAAGNLALKLGKQAAELSIMDKSWFESSGRVFTCNDERMRGRFAEEEEDEGESFEVDIILRPGFLKYGNDEGENFERYAVWVPAMLDLRNTAVEPEIPVQTDTEVRDPENDITITDPTRMEQLPPSDEQKVLLMGAPEKDLIENGAQQQPVLQPAPEDIYSQPPLDPQQSTHGKPIKNKGKRQRAIRWFKGKFSGKKSNLGNGSS